MCGPTLAWDWLVLDISYVLVLVGGGIVLRSRGSSLAAWLFFGMLSAAVGTFLFSVTYVTAQGQVPVEDVSATAAMLASC